MSAVKRKIRALVVEDHDSSREVLCRLLSLAGCAVDCAGSLAEGREVIGRPAGDGRPEVLLLDLHLPDGDGTDLLRRVRDAGLPMRVALISGVADEDRLDAARLLRPDAIFPKPILFEPVLAWLRNGSARG